MNKHNHKFTLMKVTKLLLILFTTVFITSCVVVNDNPVIENRIALEKVVSQYDLWYIDYHRTEGRGKIPFISKAFTLSFLRGNLYANNNIVNIGKTGNGLGVIVGNYNTRKGILETNHKLDGYYNFDVVQLSGNEIRIDFSNVSYYLVGYQKNNFDYDKLFYDNIEYFLQEYVAWERIGAKNGKANAFDNENYLQFTPKNNTTFYTSKDKFGTNIGHIKWDFSGKYKIYDVKNNDKLKILTLNYGNGDTEEFELGVINDGKVELYHPKSKTTYAFLGRGFVQYQRGGTQNSKIITRNSGRERTKIIRKKVDRKH